MTKQKKEAPKELSASEILTTYIITQTSLPA
nr:MAG TPA: hypothetical protein [Caudoviricetes sp.]